MTIDDLWALQALLKAERRRAAALRKTLMEALAGTYDYTAAGFLERALAADDRRLKRMRAGR